MHDVEKQDDKANLMVLIAFISTIFVHYHHVSFLCQTPDPDRSEDENSFSGEIEIG